MLTTLHIVYFSLLLVVVEEPLLSQNMSKTQIGKDNATVGLDAVNYCIEIVNDAVKDHGCLRIAISGGSFPEIFASGINESNFEKLQFDKWYKQSFFFCFFYKQANASKVQKTIKRRVFWADERCVNLKDKESSFKAFEDTILKVSKNTIQSKFIYAIDDTPENSKPNPKELALSYHKKIQSEFQISPNDIPIFDVIFLGFAFFLQFFVKKK